MALWRRASGAWHVLLGIVVVAGAGGVVLRWRAAPEPKPAETKPVVPPVPACALDRACATHRAGEVYTRAKERWNEVAPTHKGTWDEEQARFLGLALRATLERDDCDAATELLGGLERLEVDRANAPTLARAIDDATLGTRGYCARADRKSVEPPPSGSSIRLDRGMCNGECPAYTVTVTAEGDVTFEGSRFTAVTGPARGTIAPARARDLFDTFERMSFAKRPAHVGAGVTDYPTATLTLTRGTIGTTVTDRAVCFGEGSIEEGICYLEERTDQVAGTFQWVNARRDR